MELLLPVTNLPFDVGALYSRRDDIHGRYGGQTQGGISTPAKSPFVILFTGEAGAQHGYLDHWEEEDGENILHYYGEGQVGDMQNIRGNRAILQHFQNNKRLLIFQSMGKSQPYRFLGEFRFFYAYEQSGIPDTQGNLRKALVFKLKPFEADFTPFQNAIADRSFPKLDLSSTITMQFTEVRSKQSLFKRRLVNIEKQCRLTGITDLRFLRASHIKPWSKCADGSERVDGSNGLLLSPHADFLFDRGWITFEDDGALICSDHLPKNVIERIGLDLKQGRKCGNFFDKQQPYLEFHRNAVFEKSFAKLEDPLSELFATSTI
jgi:5-methylcytosine-specific restriction protein A